MSEFDSIESLPCRLHVEKIITSRYADNSRPAGWNRRVEGLDVIQVEGGRTIKIASDGQQSPPQPGWVILLDGGDADRGYTWTLYGMPR